MSEYIKALYSGWVQGKSDSEIANKAEEFVKLAAEALGRTHDEIRQFCLKQGWFK